MKFKTLDISEVSPIQWIDTLIEWLLMALLVFMPLVLGVVQPWSETVTLAAVGVLALLLAVRQSGQAARSAWTWAYVPMLLFLGLVVLQLVPLSSSIVSQLSPATVSLKSSLLAGPGGRLARLTLSFYPHATRHDLFVVLIAVVVFITVLHVYNTAAQVKRLLMAIAVVGGLVGVLALLQYLTGADKVYWTIPTPQTHNRPNGPFILYNNYAQFMNLSMGAALALLLVKSRESLPGRKLSFSNLSARLADPEFRFVGWLAGVLVVGVVTIFLSMSRGGMISLMIALVLTLLSLSRRRGLRAHVWFIAAIGLLGGLSLLYLGFDKVSDRLATIHNMPDASGGRVQIYKDVWQESFPRFPLFGMGLGAFEMTYPMFDRSNYSAVAAQADSDYIQALHEVGAIGLGLVLLFVLVIVVNYFRATRGRRSICAAAFGLGFGLLAVLIHSGSDFGQHLPAIACLSAISCALMIKLGRWPRTDEQPDPAPSRSRPFPLRLDRPLRLALPAALIAGVCWALPLANASRIADNQWDEALQTADRLSDDDWAGSSQDYAQLVAQASAAVDTDPQDVLHRYALSVYRWRAIDHALPSPEPAAKSEQQYTATTRPSITPVSTDDPHDGQLKLFDDPAPQTQPATTQPGGGAAVAADDTDDSDETAPPTTRPAALAADKLPAAREVVAELLDSRRVCPTFGPLYSMAGQIEHVVFHNPAGAAHVETGYALTRDNPVTSFAAALVDADASRWDAAREKFQHAVDLDDGMLPDVVDACLYQLDRPQFAVDIVGDNLPRLCRTAELLVRDGRHPGIANDACDRAIARIKSSGMPDLKALGLRDVDNCYLFASFAGICLHRNEYALSADYYRRALDIQYDNAWWRCRLAGCLYALGQKQAAVHEARICLRFSPNMGAARQIITDVAETPGQIAEQADGHAPVLGAQ